MRYKKKWWLKEKKKKLKIKNFYKNLKLKNWKYNFWSKFKYNYFNSKKKYGIRLLKRLFRKKKVAKWKKAGFLKFRLRFYYKKSSKPIRRHSTKKEMKKKKKKLLARLTWLKISRVRKKKKTWWLLRVNLKKTAYFYGIKKLQKFRYINNLFNKVMGLNFYAACRLECMLNMVLFRVNVFDNIYIVNNFIRACGIFVNKKRVNYPFRVVKVNEFISFPLYMFKKVFSIFVKRSKFNKSFLLKKYKKKFKKYRLMHLLKNFVNLPPYIEYNYKILHFVLWRLPTRKEFLGAYFKGKNTYDWDLDTQLKYN